MSRTLSPPALAGRRADLAGRALLVLQTRPWIGPVAVLVVAALLRFIGLGYPPHLVFDETYYVKDAWSLWHLGYEGSWDAPTGGGKVDDLFAAGDVGFYSTTAEYVAHPPLGKWIIALGEVLAGGAQNPVGWRLSVAVVGVLAVGLTMLVAHRLFGTMLVTVLAGGLFAIENQAIVLSRVGLLDDMVMLFALAGFACILQDRLWTERRFGRWLMERRRGIGDWGPTFLWRPWLLLAGVAFGLCSGVKWSGIYFLAFFIVYAAGSDVLLRRRAGVRFWWLAGPLKQLPVIVVETVIPAVLAYLVCWTGWFVTAGGYDRHTVEDGGTAAFQGALSWVPRPLQDLWAWHVSIYQFHVTLDKPHAYAAPAILWPIIGRPTSMYWDAPNGTCQTCTVSAITDIPNPLIWYAAIAAAVYLVVRFVRRREWQAGLILMGIAAGYLPWLQYPRRTMFSFYSIAFEPFLMLGLAAVIGLMVVRSPRLDLPDDALAADARLGLRARRGVVVGFLALAVLMTLFFLPLSTGLPVPYWYWHVHMWSTQWI